MATTKAKELSEKAGRYAAVAPALERIEAVDDRLAVMEEEARSSGGYLPKSEVAERFVAWLRSRRDEVEHPRSHASGAPLPAPSVVWRLSADRGVETDTPREVFALIAWILGPEFERRALEAVARSEYEEGLSSEERERRRVALAAERKRLIEEREVAVETVRAAGMDFPHLPETQSRIEQEQRAEEQRAEQRARQEEAKKEIEQREGPADVPPTRFGRTVVVGGERSALIGRMTINGEPLGV